MFSVLFLNYSFPSNDAGDEAELSQTPQMVTISFNGAVTQKNMEIYQSIFNDERVNPNGCTPKGTFFVSHKYTNYSAVQELHRKGHEIGVFSITNRKDEKYWSEGTYDDWLAEMAGARLVFSIGNLCFNQFKAAHFHISLAYLRYQPQEFPVSEGSASHYES